MRAWFSIGVLVLAAGMPYCSAALGWAATQDDYNIYIREDVAMGLIVAWLGWSILTIVLIACVIVIAGSLLSILCTAVAAWLTGSGYVVTPGRPF